MREIAAQRKKEEEDRRYRLCYPPTALQRHACRSVSVSVSAMLLPDAQRSGPVRGRKRRGRVLAMGLRACYAISGIAIG
eukprot:1930777-Rhodomonas_salina.1